jgi:predicted Rossmann fold flavoprotein
VTKFLEKELRRLGVDVRLNTKVLDIIAENDRVKKVITEFDEIECDSAIIATGGKSYSSTGSTGDGYVFAKKFGHKIINPKPSLVGVELFGSDHLKMQGLSLKNVSITAFVNDKIVYNDFGEMLFTHFGVSGPIVLSSSCYLTKYSLENAKFIIDLKPALTIETLDAKFIRLFADNNNKNLSIIMRSVVPSSLVDVVLDKANVSGKKKCAEITKVERFNIINTLKNLEFKIKRLRPIEEAIITSGGVSVKDINPKTLESKLVKGLYFCGEVIDVDAFTGGFNMQIAFSTGYAAGSTIK